MSTAATKQQREKNPYPGRRESLRKLLAAEEHEYFFVSGLANIRYLTGFHASNGIVLMAPDGPVLYTDGRYAIQARQQAGEVGRPGVQRRVSIRCNQRSQGSKDTAFGV